MNSFLEKHVKNVINEWSCDLRGGAVTITIISKQMAKKRTYYNKEFRLKAIKEMIESNVPIVELSKRLGVDANLLRQWKSRFINSRDNLIEKHEEPISLEEENLLLKKKVLYLQNELSILKKAMTIFMRDSV